MREQGRWAISAVVLSITCALTLGGGNSPADAATRIPGCPVATGERIVNTPATYPKTVALTFDDGPSPTWTPRVLAILARHHVHATFFVIGRNAVVAPQTLAQTIAAGNAIGDHTWHHPTTGLGMYGLTERQLAAELDPETAMIKNATGRSVCFFRAPQGKDQSPLIHRMAEDRGQTVTAYYTAGDYQQPGKLDPAWVTRIEHDLENRGDHPILLMHDGGVFRGNTLQALEGIISWYAQRGYVFTDPAGRPFPGDLPAGDSVPPSGWAIPPGWTAPDNSTGGSTTGSAGGTPSAGQAAATSPDWNRRMATLAAQSGQDPLSAQLLSEASARYLMVFSAPPA